jgi:hypothetical protein
LADKSGALYGAASSGGADIAGEGSGVVLQVSP